MNTSLTWSEHLENQFKKTNKVLSYLRKNSNKVNKKVKMCLYKSPLLPILSYGTQFIHMSRLDLQKTENIQKRVLKCITKNFKLNYEGLLQFYPLPLSIYLQLNSPLFFSSLLEQKFCLSPIPIPRDAERRKKIIL